MATVVELVLRGDLIKFDPPLSPAEFEDRKIYLVPQACEWLKNTLPGLGSTWNIEVTPEEQADQFLTDFCSGERLAVNHGIKLLQPVGQGVWELKTADLRIFGWFVKRDQFVMSSCEAKERLKDVQGLYHGYINEAVHRRNHLDLDEPKFIAGDNVNDVVSNWYFP
jgi:hypothetical protein